ncbi:MAG: restriction endonuclease [Candidatus Gracilibacteria bacterium]|nr:restriction endonuclease [Candidatus Gracilibacteria bacterium]
MIPKFNKTMLPILEAISDGKEYTLSEVVERLYLVFNVSDEEKKEKVANGTLSFNNKVGWGKSYIRQAGLISHPKRGVFKITKEGKNVLSENLDEITVDYLKKYPSFVKFITPNKKQKIDNKDNNSNNIDNIENIDDLTPMDLIKQGYDNLNKVLQSELLEELKKVDPYRFEKIILELFKKMGYGDFEETPKSGDGGIDGIIHQDQLGIERIYTQAKRYTKNKVGERDIRNFIGAMSGDVNKGIFVTTSDFDKKAIKKAKEAKLHKIILINGDDLIDLMIKYDIGVQVKNVYKIKKVDSDFFSDN